MIEKLLKNKTQKDKIKIKSKELSKIKLGKFKKDGFDIEIISDIVEIKGGIELYAKVNKNGNRVGFGKDGTVEIERFQIFNPPVLIDDNNGDIIRKWDEEDHNTKVKTPKQRKLKYNPEECLKQVLGHTIKLSAKSGDNIIDGKIGRTVGTFYPAAGANEPVDGTVNKNGAVWSTQRDATTSDGANDTAASNFWGVNDVSGANYNIYRGIFGFDTSVIAIGSVSSGTFSGYSIATADDDDNMSVGIIKANQPASTSAIAVADYDAFPTRSEVSDTRIDISTWDSGSSYRDFTLNATGIAHIAVTGITWFMSQLSGDLDDSAPTVGNNHASGYMADETGTSKDPKLVLDYTTVTIYVQNFRVRASSYETSQVITD